MALHRARQALQDGECELAIVGGVNLLLGPELFIAFGKAGMLSHAGHCHTFAANADGYVFYSNVNVLEEMADMMAASRSFETSVEIMNRARSMQQGLLQLGNK